MLSYHFDWSIITSGKYFEWLVAGVKVTLQLSAAGIVLSFLLGLIGAGLMVTWVLLTLFSVAMFEREAILTRWR